MRYKKPVKRKRSKPKARLLKDGSLPENVIQAEILDWLKESGLLHWRQNSGNVFAGFRKVKLGDAGLPDIVIIIPPQGRVLGLEVKSKNGTLRPKQKEFRDSVVAAGGYYRVARTLHQAMDAVAETIGEEQWKLLSSSQGRTPEHSELQTARRLKSRGSSLGVADFTT